VRKSKALFQLIEMRKKEQMGQPAGVAESKKIEGQRRDCYR